MKAAHCQFCDFTLTKIGLWVAHSQMRVHVRSAHPEKYGELLKAEAALCATMNELRRVYGHAAKIRY